MSSLCSYVRVYRSAWKEAQRVPTRASPEYAVASFIDFPRSKNGHIACEGGLHDVGFVVEDSRFPSLAIFEHDGIARALFCRS
jgi:hypothetical protein